MGSKLFVEGLPPSFSTQQLMDLFAPFGTVLSALVIIDPTGKSLRMGKVEMSTPREAEQAIQKLHRSHVQGMLLLVVEYEEKDRSTGPEKKGAP
jgi:RNA recognition motif-containing protein